MGNRFIAIEDRPPKKTNLIVSTQIDLSVVCAPTSWNYILFENII